MTSQAASNATGLESASDGELICRIALRDGDAFAALHRRYADDLFGFALNRLRDRGRAEDALQEAFAAIWRSAATYRPERGPGRPWLYTVVRNAIVDRARARHEPPAEPPEREDKTPGPAHEAEAAWVRSRVHDAVAQLPELERDAIVLAYWRGLSQSEVAARLDIPLGTVKTRTRRALERLAEILEKDAVL